MTKKRGITDRDIERNAFVSGYNQIRQRPKGRSLAVLVLDEIAHALKNGGMSDACISARKLGYVDHSIAERDWIEKIFKKHGVSNPWGTK